MITLSLLKGKNMYPSFVIYQAYCTCKQNHIDETERNVTKRWGKCNNPAQYL